MDLAINDTPLVGIMQSGRWRIPASVLNYIRAVAAAQGAVTQWYQDGDGDGAEASLPHPGRRREHL